MILGILLFAAGLFAGWFFLAPPAFAKKGRDALLRAFPDLGRYHRTDIER